MMRSRLIMRVFIKGELCFEKQVRWSVVNIYWDEYYKRRIEELKKIREHKMKRIENAVWDFFCEDMKLYGFEEREGQQNMALDIVESIRDQEHILVEAGVGIGKSFAYIVPLLYYYREYNEPIAIATSTIALQEQLEGDIKKIANLLEITAPTIIAKGQTNFVCRQRLEDYNNQIKECCDRELIIAILENAEKDISDRRDFPLLIPFKIWNQINIQDYGYKKCHKCLYHNKCLYYQLRQKLPSFKGFIICNQDLLTVHLQKVADMRRSMLNEQISIMVIDEAHNLEDKIRGVSTTYYSKQKINNILNKATNVTRSLYIDIDRNVQRINKKVEALFCEFKKQIQIQVDENPAEMKYAEKFFLKENNKITETISVVFKEIKYINDKIQIFLDYEHISESDKRSAEDIEDLYKFFSRFTNQKHDYLSWLEKNNLTVYFYQCPKHIDKKTYNLYFSMKKPQVILTSATLSNKGEGSNEERYSYFLKNTGFPAQTGFMSEPKESPFPYNEHAIVYYSDDLPHPIKQREMFIQAATERIEELLAISKGKALMLFTAKSDMEVVYKNLLEKRLPYHIFKQESGASQEEVLEEFRNDTNSVLLGTGAFWEGINIEGDSLSNLIIFRLPFPVPDPIIEYKRSNSENPLMDVNVPEMIIKLKQGIGRLIRSEEDKGIVSIIDPRLKESSTAPYKELVWKSLPIKIKTNSISEIKAFYDKVIRKSS